MAAGKEDEDASSASPSGGEVSYPSRALWRFPSRIGFPFRGVPASTLEIRPDNTAVEEEGVAVNTCRPHDPDWDVGGTTPFSNCLFFAVSCSSLSLVDSLEWNTADARGSGTRTGTSSTDDQERWERPSSLFSRGRSHPSWSLCL